MHLPKPRPATRILIPDDLLTRQTDPDKVHPTILVDIHGKIEKGITGNLRGRVIMIAGYRFAHALSNSALREPDRAAHRISGFPSWLTSAKLPLPSEMKSEVIICLIKRLSTPPSYRPAAPQPSTMHNPSTPPIPESCSRPSRNLPIFSDTPHPRPEHPPFTPTTPTSPPRPLRPPTYFYSDTPNSPHVYSSFNTSFVFFSTQKFSTPFLSSCSSVQHSILLPTPADQPIAPRHRIRHLLRLAKTRVIVVDQEIVRPSL